MSDEKSKPTMEEFERSSYLAGGNAPYIEAMYDLYLEDPTSVDAHWAQYFSGVQNGAADVSHYALREELRDLIRHPQAAMPASGMAAQGQEAVDNLIENYRRFGHFSADINPLGNTSKPDPRLTLEHYHLSQSDLDSTFQTRGVLHQPTAPLREILEALKSNYTQSIGCEFMYIDNDDEREWIRDYIERRIPDNTLSEAVKKRILQKLIAADGLEKYLDRKYPGVKRFSVEGGDAIIPMLDELGTKARAEGVGEIVYTMAHRGRLNVLMNILGQSAEALFQQFDGAHEVGLTSGDVKYHRGFSSDITTQSGQLHLSLAFNPSHLEYINPVAMGSVRLRQDRFGEDHTDHHHAMAVLIHGDAAFAGQGIVMEGLNMSQPPAYNTGGSIHIVINNQVGFTTSNPIDARTGHYCTDTAKIINAPIFHVNGDDPEAAIHIIHMAMDYRSKFKKDFVIDLVCYRRHGHQEVDEPRATQPKMYQIIDKHPEPHKLYTQQLMNEKIISAEQATTWWNDYRDALDAGKQVVETVSGGLQERFKNNWEPFINRDWREPSNTGLDRAKIDELAKKIVTLPEGFTLQRNVGMIMKARAKMAVGEQPMDWGFGETMAYATLLDQGYPVRIVGEDVRRGTFFHRQATLHEFNTGEEYTPLKHISDEQARLQIYDSVLAEAGPLGFEYGYAAAEPKQLVIWEAQFGDFANVAQVIVDQFLSSAWQKWNRLSGLVMLLPHGYEGMGPEHSSARLERYLQLTAQHNIQVCVPTTPAQIYHLLRRQVVRQYRRPLIVMTPKSLLRHKMAVSSLDDLASGEFQLVIPDNAKCEAKKVKRVVACTGKVYYDLIAYREENHIDNVAIIRVEQLYPFPYEEVSEALAPYTEAQELVWCQEEPKNQGAWFCCMRERLEKCKHDNMSLRLISRPASAAPAVGYPAMHKKQQQEIIEKVFRFK